MVARSAGVERTEGLVQQHEAGLDGQRPGQRDPLLLPAGELMRVAIARGRPCPTASSRSATASRRSAAGEAEADVGRHRQMREQAALLRHVADAAAFRWHVGAGPVDDRSPSATVPLSACSKPAMTRSSVVLPLPDGPRMAVSESLRNIEVDAVAGPRRAAERLRQARDGELGHVTIIPSACAERLKNLPRT